MAARAAQYLHGNAHLPKCRLFGYNFTMKNNGNAVLEASVGMALVDSLPVVFFAVSGIMLALICKNVLFTTGIVLCVCAGLGKVLWKLLLAICKKNAVFLTRQFKFLMPAGFLLILIYICLNFGVIEWRAVFAAVRSMPSVVFFAVCAVLMLVMFVLGFSLNQNSAKANWAEQIINTFAQISFLAALLPLVK